MHYYDNLMNVSMHNNMEQWLKFFLVGIIETATIAMDTFRKILMKLRKRAANAQALLLYLYHLISQTSYYSK